jgi:hypothetical protein
VKEQVYGMNSNQGALGMNGLPRKTHRSIHTHIKREGECQENYLRRHKGTEKLKRTQGITGGMAVEMDVTVLIVIP